MRYCSTCGSENPDESRFCQECGQAIHESENQTRVSRSTNKWVFIVAGFLFLILLGLAAYSFLDFSKNPPSIFTEEGMASAVAEQSNSKNVPPQKTIPAEKTTSNTISPVNKTATPIKINATSTAMPSAMLKSPSTTTTNQLSNVQIPYYSSPQIDGMKMALVPAGEFVMGTDTDPDAFKDEKPAHLVYLDSYWIDMTEVTNGMYEQCMQAGNCTPQVKLSHNTATGSNHFGSPEYAEYPAVYVNWQQANEYCQWAGRRLPTEAEWEKAARGSNGLRYPWGNSSPTLSLVIYKDAPSGDTIAAESYLGGASPYGALHMAGNVWEWVADVYHGSYYSTSPYENPRGPGGSDVHVLRGGSFVATPVYLRTTVRESPSSLKTEGYGSGNWGFRCAMDVD